MEPKSAPPVGLTVSLAGRVGTKPFLVGITRAGVQAAAAHLGLRDWSQVELYLKGRLLEASAAYSQQGTPASHGLRWNSEDRRWERVFSSVTVGELLNGQHRSA